MATFSTESTLTIYLRKAGIVDIKYRGNAIVKANIPPSFVRIVDKSTHSSNNMVMMKEGGDKGIENTTTLSNDGGSNAVNNTLSSMTSNNPNTTMCNVHLPPPPLTSPVAAYSLGFNWVGSSFDCRIKPTRDGVLLVGGNIMRELGVEVVGVEGEGNQR